MNTFTVRTVIATAVAGLALATLSIPASAAETDPDVLAAQICPPGTEAPDVYDAEFADYAERADVSLYVYETSAAIDGDEDTGVIPAPAQLCVFAIVSTDDDATLDGTYSLSIAGNEARGAISGSESTTTALAGATDLAQVATFTATGQQTMVDVDKATKAEKKKAAKKYSAAKKKAKKKYSKAGKTAKAKRKLSKELAAAKKKYKAAIATKRTTTKRPYSLSVELPIDR